MYSIQPDSEFSLMADVTRAMEKAQEAVARIASNAVAGTAETESTTSSHLSAHS